MSFTIILQYLSEIFFNPDVFVVSGAISVTATDKDPVKKITLSDTPRASVSRKSLPLQADFFDRVRASEIKTGYFDP